MRVSHTELENLRSDPRRWLATKTTQQHGFRIGGFKVWGWAVRHYHRTGREAAIDYLEETFWRHLKRSIPNERRLSDFIIHLNVYCDEFESSGHVALEFGRRINCIVSTSFTVSGEVSRVDLCPDRGFAVYLFKEKSLSWAGQLRMPLIQSYFAAELTSPLDEVAVGIYNMELGRHEERRYSSAAVDAARAEAQKLADTIARQSESRAT